jgi:lysophospholipase L1-like esterase
MPLNHRINLLTGATEYFIEDTSKTYDAAANIPTTSNVAVIPKLSTISFNMGSAGRPTVLFFGNSIASQNNRFLQIATTTISSAIRAGSTVLPVAATTAFVITAGAFVIGNKYKILVPGTTDFTLIGALDSVAGTVFMATGVGTGTGTAIHRDIAINQPGGGFFLAKIESLVAGVSLTIDNPLPRTITTISGQNIISKYQNGYPLTSMTYGPFASIFAQLGHPVEILAGFGFSGSYLYEVIFELSKYLKFYRPTYVILQVLENDLNGNGFPVSAISRWLKAACTLCINTGAIPIVTTCLPRSTINSPSLIAAWDAMYSFAMTLPALVPGTVVVDWSTPWLDLGLTTSRAPLSGWTDGTHPSPGKWQTIAALSQSSLANIFKYRTSHEDIALWFSDMSGTSGTFLGTATGVTATGTLLYGTSDITVTGSKTPANKQNIVFASTSSTVATTQALLVTTSYGMTVAYGGQWVRGFMRVKLKSASNVGTLQIEAIQDNSNLNHTINASYTTFGADPAMINTEITMETAPFKLLSAVATAKMQIIVRPGTTAAMTGEIEIIEIGFLPATEDISYQ